MTATCQIPRSAFSLHDLHGSSTQTGNRETHESHFPDEETGSGINDLSQSFINKVATLWTLSAASLASPNESAGLTLGNVNKGINIASFITKPLHRLFPLPRTLSPFILTLFFLQGSYPGSCLSTFRLDQEPLLPPSLSPPAFSPSQLGSLCLCFPHHVLVILGSHWCVSPMD